MPKLKITYPQIYFETKEVEVSDSEAEHIIHSACDEEATKFIWNKMGESEQQHTLGESFVGAFVDMDQAKIDLT